MSPIHVSASLYLRVLCKIHVSGFMSQHLYISGSSARSMSPDPYKSIHMYLRILCKIMSPGSCLSIFASQGPLQDPCLRIHVSASSYLRILCKIHVSDSCLSIHVSASICISGSSARSMSPDPNLSSHMYFRILYKIHVFGFMSQHPLVWILYKGASARSMSSIHVLASVSSDFVALRRRNANVYLRRRVLCGPAQGKQSGRDPLERFAQAKRKF